MNTFKGIFEMSEHEDLKFSMMYKNKASNARQRKIDFNLSFSKFKSLKKTKTCYFTGLTLTKDNHTIDRVNSAEGYTSKNSVACEDSVNRLKNILFESNNYDPDLVIKLCEKMKELLYVNRNTKT